MVGQSIRWLITGYNTLGYNPQYDISNFVGANVFPNILPQNYGLPAIVYTITGSEPSRIKELRAIGNTIDIDVDIIDDSYAVVNQISTLVMNNLHRYINTFNSNDSDSIGYGTPTGTNTYGMYAPASTGAVQYVGGLQIIDLYFNNSTEYYDDKLENYRNTLNFKLTYIDDPTIWGSDLYIKLEDLNLMATNVGGSDNPLYTQPLAINQGVNYLFSPSVFTTDNPNVSSTTLDGIYENFYDTTGTSNTNRPTLKQSADTPPKYNGLNYLEFGESKFLLSSQASDRLDRKYSAVTFFSVFTLPDSFVPNTKSAAICFKQDSTSTASGGIGVLASSSGSAETGSTAYSIIGMALEDDGAGGEIHRGFTFFTIVSWPFIGINTNLRFSDPVYFSASFTKTDSDELSGEYEIITSSDFTIYGDSETYSGWSDTASTTFKSSFFNFESLHSDITSFDTRGGGTIDLNDELHLYDFLIWPDKLTFGSNKYLQVKRNIIEKHDMYKRITN